MTYEAMISNLDESAEILESCGMSFSGK